VQRQWRLEWTTPGPSGSAHQTTSSCCHHVGNVAVAFLVELKARVRVDTLTELEAARLRHPDSFAPGSDAEQDHWDSALGIYQHIPQLGAAIRAIKHRF